MATYQFRLIWAHFPRLPYCPSFQDDWNVEAYSLQIVIFKPNPQYKEKAAESPQGIQMTGLGGEKAEGWAPLLEICLSGSRRGWHQAWVTSACSREGKGKLWTWPPLHSSHGMKIIPRAEYFERTWNKVASPAQIVGCVWRQENRPFWDPGSKLLVMKIPRATKGSLSSPGSTH